MPDPFSDAGRARVSTARATSAATAAGSVEFLGRADGR